VGDLEDLGTPPVFADILRVGYAVARLQLPTDPTVSREMAAAAAKVDEAVLAMQSAVDLAIELRDEGARQPVSLIPLPEAGLDTDRELVWYRHAGLQAAVTEFVGTSVGFPPPSTRAVEFGRVMTEAAQVLHALEEQRALAASMRRPTLPEPPDPAPSAAPPLRESGHEDSGHRPVHVIGPRDDGDGPPAAVRTASLAAERFTSRSELTRARAPSTAELEIRVKLLRPTPPGSDPQLGVETRNPERDPAGLREMVS